MILGPWEWLERSDRERRKGFECGIAVICPRHRRPMNGMTFAGIESCGCSDGTTPEERTEIHGLREIRPLFGGSVGFNRRPD